MMKCKSIKYGFAFLLLCLGFLSQVWAKYTPQSYIKTFERQSVNLMQETGIPASIILGIAMLESGFGNSKNCVLLNNHFGIVGSNNLKARGIKYKSRYKSYESDSASYAHFCTVIQSKPYYAKLKGTTKTSTWLKNIGRTYSRSYKNWMKRVLNLIKKYHLNQYDKGNING